MCSVLQHGTPQEGRSCSFASVESRFCAHVVLYSVSQGAAENDRKGKGQGQGQGQGLDSCLPVAHIRWNNFPFHKILFLVPFMQASTAHGKPQHRLTGNNRLCKSTQNFDSLACCLTLRCSPPDNSLLCNRPFSASTPVLRLWSLQMQLQT